MQPVSPKWLASGLVLVCQRCSKERIPEESPEVAERIGDFSLRDWLKAELKEHGQWGPIRVISTTCMDVCAKGKVTVCLDPKNGDPPQVFIVDPIEERDEVYRAIVRAMAPKGDGKTDA
jgi:predicted metal-binding protein